MVSLSLSNSIVTGMDEWGWGGPRRLHRIASHDIL
jgi:hypothetical protein